MWSVGGGVNNTEVFNILLKINRVLPDTVLSVYDCYNILKWMGGRPFLHVPKISSLTYINRINTLNKSGIGFNHVFSNYYIKEADLDDEDGNFFLENTHNTLNGVICANEIMAKYIRKKYPYFKLLGSCTIEEKKKDAINKLLELYDIIIIPPSMNNDPKLLEKFDASRLEIMVSESCYSNCLVRKQHYSLVNKWNITHNLQDLDNYYKFFYHNPNTCINKNKTNKNKHHLYMSKDRINYFRSNGVHSFKLQERYDEKRTIYNIIKFLVQRSNEPIKDRYKILKTIPNKYIINYLINKY